MYLFRLALRYSFLECTTFAHTHTHVPSLKSNLALSLSPLFLPKITIGTNLSFAKPHTAKAKPVQCNGIKSKYSVAFSVSVRVSPLQYFLVKVTKEMRNSQHIYIIIAI